MKFVNIQEEYKNKVSDLNLILENFVRSGKYVLGDGVLQFEKEWASFIGTKHSVGVANGMDALEIAMRALGIKNGDEVITTSMTAFATALAIVRVGATPVLADIDPQSALLDINSVKRCITDRTKAIIVVHLYGRVSKMDEWKNLCRSKNLFLIEDCAQSHGGAENGVVSGAFGDVSAFSFYPTKNLGALGDAGALCSNNENLIKKSTILRNYGQSKAYEHELVGINSRLDELQALFLKLMLPNLKENNKRRQKNAEHYYRNIDNSLVTLLDRPRKSEKHVFHQFVIKIKERTDFIKFMAENDIPTLIHYPKSLNVQKALKNAKIDPNGLKCSESHSKMCVSIPCHPGLSKDQLNFITNKINEFRKN